jgi:hypothetical protein
VYPSAIKGQENKEENIAHTTSTINVCQIHVRCLMSPPDARGHLQSHALEQRGRTKLRLLPRRHFSVHFHILLLLAG